jgi:hypothetical protein
MRVTKKELLAIPRCNVALQQGAEGRRTLHMKPIRCGLEPGHGGNHICFTRSCRFEWWNESVNPQQQTTA